LRRRKPEERYQYAIRKQQRELEEYAACEIERAGDLLTWYKLCKKEMPDDQYRACAFFINKEYLRKPGSLTLLYELYQQCNRELPHPTKELALDLLAYRYKVYALALQKGGY
jgi:hypothetical protein